MMRYNRFVQYGPIQLVTHDVTPAPGGPRIEQIGWGVARQVARRWSGFGSGRTGLLPELAELAEAPGHAAYACFEGREATALALLRVRPEGATHLGQASPHPVPPEVSTAFVVRMLHDAGHAGAATLTVPHPVVDLAAFGPVTPR